jgi:hypothetical protein
MDELNAGAPIISGKTYRSSRPSLRKSVRLAKWLGHQPRKEGRAVPIDQGDQDER